MLHNDIDIGSIPIRNTVTKVTGRVSCFPPTRHNLG